MRMLNMQPFLAGKRSSRALTSTGQEHAAVDTMYAYVSLSTLDVLYLYLISILCASMN